MPRKKVIYYRDFEQMPPMLSAEDVAVLLNRDVWTIRKYAREGTIPAKKLGKSWLFDKNAIRKFIESGEAA